MHAVNHHVGQIFAFWFNVVCHSEIVSIVNGVSSFKLCNVASVDLICILF